MEEERNRFFPAIRMNCDGMSWNDAAGCDDGGNRTLNGTDTLM